MKLIFLFIFFTFLYYSFSFAQYTNIMIGNQNSPNEVSICINPKNTNQLVAGANISNCYYSTNGGLNWTWRNLTSTYGVWGDPIIMVDTAGSFYFFHLSNPQSGSWIDRIVCQKSTDGGVTWNNGSYAGLNPPKKQDKEGVVIDRANNVIYMTWTEFDSYISNPPLTDSSRILFSKSTDAGISWTPVVRIDKLGGDCIDEDNTVEGAVPAVGPNGYVYVAWAGPKIRNSQFGIFFNKSTNGGQTWLADPIYIANQPGGWDYGINGIYRCNGLPQTVCDVSNGPYRGTIYINWTDSAGNNDHDVRLIKSTNGGLNWSTVKRVNNDPAGKEQFFTWMTVDQATGYLYFVFYDRRNYSDNLTTDVYMARSTDGGETFTNFVVSSTPMVPNGSTFFGDYNGISAYAGKVRPIWTRLVGGQLSIWTAIVDFPIPGGSVINITALIEGYYNGVTMNTCDTVKAYLRNITTPYALVDSAFAIIDSVNFTGSFRFMNANNGTYYLVLKHRNSIETWSKSGGIVFMKDSSMSYDFTTAATQAYGNNMKLKNGKFCFYSGDENQDGAVDALDMIAIDNDAANFITGYVSTDLNGDGAVDALDMIICDNNVANFVSAIKPPGAPSIVKIPRTFEEMHIIRKKLEQYEEIKTEQKNKSIKEKSDNNKDSKTDKNQNN
jgi:hypothetical protein